MDGFTAGITYHSRTLIGKTKERILLLVLVTRKIKSKLVWENNESAKEWKIIYQKQGVAQSEQLRYFHKSSFWEILDSPCLTAFLLPFQGIVYFQLAIF